MVKDHLPLLEDQNPVRRSEILAGTGSAKVALTEAIKSLSNVSGREADIVNGMMYKPMENRSSLHILIHSGNIFFTGPIMEALTIYSNALIEHTTLARNFLKLKRR